MPTLFGKARQRLPELVGGKAPPPRLPNERVLDCSPREGQETSVAASDRVHVAAALNRLRSPIEPMIYVDENGFYMACNELTIREEEVKTTLELRSDKAIVKTFDVARSHGYVPGISTTIVLTGLDVRLRCTVDPA